MTKTSGFSYAVVLAAAFVLWVPVALFGTQGFSALLGLAAIPAAFFAPLKRTNIIALAVALLALWATATSLWSAENTAIVAGDLAHGNFNVDAAAIRILLTVLAGTLVLAAALRLEPSRGQIAVYVMLAMLAIHGGLTLAMALLPEVALDAYAPFSDRDREAPQNILRSANAFLLGLPVLLGAACLLPKRAPGLVVTALLAASFLAFYLVGSDVAWIGILLIAVALGVIHLLPKSGFKALFAVIAAFVLASPVILGFGGAAVSDAGMPLPSSVQSRVWAWQLTTDKILERPLTGHGIEASKEWRETFGDRPDLMDQMIERTGIDDGRWKVYRILPGHPHNMGLQLWAETGFIGIVLALISLLAIGWSLPPPAALPSATRIAAAGLTAASFALFSLSYSVWNEAFWATVALAAAGILLLSRWLDRP
ncbi:MAG: O-antigen ligase family protein [Henriciella sp.]|uniref:O-antigen ligase family protein n=1 Tax=Henriciella sp. TaxID=1968823 RepID=UPI003C71341B